MKIQNEFIDYFKLNIKLLEKFCKQIRKITKTNCKIISDYQNKEIIIEGDLFDYRNTKRLTHLTLLNDFKIEEEIINIGIMILHDIETIKEINQVQKELKQLKHIFEIWKNIKKEIK